MLNCDVDVPISANPLRNGTPSPIPPTSLLADHIAEALSKSPDYGATIDLTHKELTDVGDAGAELLANIGQEAGSDCAVVRIALAYNRLSTLPNSFTLLSRLRYLVLKNNNFTVFPEVLTAMPSLEILDISRNKLRKLPSQPGTLVHLKVFSLMRNKLHQLPTYLARFQELTVFKIEQNPIEWPPKSTLESPKNIDNPEVMKDWIKRVQEWIDGNAHLPPERKMSEDSIHSLSSNYEESEFPALTSTPEVVATKAPQATALYHARSFSLESDHSTYFLLDRSHSSHSEQIDDAASEWPSRLRLDSFMSDLPNGGGRSSRSSPDSYYPLDESEHAIDHDELLSLYGQQVAPVSATLDVSKGSATLASKADNLTVKRSVPGVRPLKLHHSAKDEGAHSHGPSTSAVSAHPNGLTTAASRQPFSSDDHSPGSSLPVERPAPAMDKERHSYFRRLSSLAPLNLSKTIPEDLLAFIDAARGILFGVSQIYQTLQHYTVYAIDERLSTVLLKVLDPASVYLTQFISALDRFDTMSKRTLPPPSVCRAVAESCRDNVTVFGKAVGVLALQLKVLSTHDDVRYTRQMLLTLYGAMAEIASSWQAISRRVEAVKPLLWEVRPPPASKSYVVQGSDQPRLRPNAVSNSLDHGKTRVTRRHAGSFSSKDVEIGKMLPSIIDIPSFTTGVINGAAPTNPVPRTARRVGTPLGSAPPIAMTAPTSSGHHYLEGISPGTGTHPMSHWDSHSRQGSQSSLTASSPVTMRLGQADTNSTSTLVDREAIDAMKQALEAAPAIWEMTGEIVSDSQEGKVGLKETLRKAQDVAERLRRDIEVIQDGGPTVDRKPLHDDARLFAKTVIQLSIAIKTHVATHPLSSKVRANMVKLTNATEEFVILLHVSSFSPAPTPRPYSPLVVHPSPLSTPDEGKLGASLSRSRSVLSAAASKLASPIRELPHSALPHQSFAIPAPPQFGPLRKETADDSLAVPG